MKRAGILLKELETVKQIIHDTPLTGSWSDPGSADSLEAWTAIERYKDICQQLILVNLEFALDHQLHHELWMVAFKKPISLLQSKCQDKKSPLRLEAQSDLYWYIDSGSGFYLRLLGFICDAHGTDLPFRR
ncbi:unnamed protein product [Cyprideis torosa]|uniref:Uncharacterized protein n=1 Tax=Cyprideis torosa TaxID=163714 RepID=A0A7R8ZTZ6_9CRUS|nr:unnamed protein product [Cyprideis torosa]CAG0908968.1 unnamed protein product [Cyprideis torosa]